MKKFRNRCTALLVVPAVLFAVMLSGCERHPYEQKEDDNFEVRFTGEKPAHLSVVMGNHANAYQINASAIKPLIEDVCHYGGSITVISSDGSPGDNKKNVHEEIELPNAGKNNRRYENDVQSNIKDVIKKCNSCVAQADDVDILGALRIVAEEDEKRSDECILVVMDTGYSTAGILNLKNLPLLNVDSTIANLSASDSEGNSEIPNFDNYAGVYWLGMNEVYPPQPEGTKKDNAKIKQLWSSIFEEGGADLMFLKIHDEKEPDADLPDVKIIEVSTETETDAVVYETPSETDFASIEEPSESETDVPFPEEDFSFKNDSADFVDRQEALENIEPIVDFFNTAWKDEKIVLVGCTSTWRDPKFTEEQSKQRDIELSGQRAEAVKALLVEKGMKSENILCHGAGSESAFYIQDRNLDISVSDSDPNANFIEEKGRENRMVHACKADDPRVQKYLNSQE